MDIIGKKFGRLEVERIFFYDKWRKQRLLCKCDCGDEKIVLRSDLLSGKVKSCGCFRKEKASEGAKTHGLTKDPLYKVWISIKKRCLNPNCKDFKYYGGRGIKICEEWLDFKSFYDWAISNGYNHDVPRSERTIDRIDTDGDYCPENCRFANMTIQNRNKHYKNKLYVPYISRMEV